MAAPKVTFDSNTAVAPGYPQNTLKAGYQTEDATDLDVFISSLQDQLRRFNARLEHLETLSDKLGGPIPRGADGGPQNDPNGKIEHLNMLQAALFGVGEKIDGEISRLQKLI